MIVLTFPAVAQQDVFTVLSSAKVLLKQEDFTVTAKVQGELSPEILKTLKEMGVKCLVPIKNQTHEEYRGTSEPD